MAGILDLLTQPANTGFAPAPQSASPFASLLQGLGINFAHIPQRPTPDMSAVHALTSQLMGGLIPMPVPLPQIQLPTTHAPSAAQTMQAANAVAGGQSPFWPGPFRSAQQ
jgi:hypothetical protein